MNPLDATIIRLGIYIGQLEAQVGELHSQLLAKTKECEDLKASAPKEKPNS